jgi:hypothetical protein
MAQQSRTTVKTYFETGDTPTQAQFGHLIDSALNLTDDTSDALSEGSTNLYVSSAQKDIIDAAVISDVTGVTGADAITNIISLTSAEYAAITPDVATLYVITDA